MKVSILNRFTAEVIITVDVECQADDPVSLRLGLAVRAALGLNADLRSADLTSADLRSADLQYANLRSADLRSADLTSADLRSADLTSADLRSADLTYADLTSANLTSANLTYADLTSANLTSANLTSPTMVLLANWSGGLSLQLTADLMEYDASCHPDRAAFDKWAAGGDCPYNGIHVQRAANFTESQKLWGTGKLCGAYELMLRLFAERGIKR